MYSRRIVYETKTKFGYYQVVDTIYTGRWSRVLYSGQKYQTAQSAIPLDGNKQMVFGYNQRFVELIEAKKPSSILLIGGGAYSLPIYILNNMPSTAIDVVELNPDLLTIATKYFGLKTNKRLSIIHKLGYDYLAVNSKQYDLIIIDAYNDEQMDRDLLSDKAAVFLSKSLKKSGLVAMNVISSLMPGSLIGTIKDNYSNIFNSISIYPADITNPDRHFNNNYILVAAKADPQLKLSYPLIALGF